MLEVSQQRDLDCGLIAAGDTIEAFGARRTALRFLTGPSRSPNGLFLSLFGSRWDDRPTPEEGRHVGTQVAPPVSRRLFQCRPAPLRRGETDRGGSLRPRL